MQLYPKTAAELVLDLITAANPSLPFPLNSTLVSLGPVSAIAVVPPAIANTSVRINTKPNSPYIGNKVVQYQRINLANLFKDITPNIRKYSATGEAGQSPFTVYQLLSFINAQYGLNLSEDDVTNANFPAYSTITENGVSKRVSSVSMTAKATSQAFIGSVVVRAEAGKRELESMITKQELSGRTYPGGNDFVTVTKDRLNMMGYGTDWTEMMLASSAYGPAWMVWRDFVVGAGTNTANAAVQQKFFDAINTQLTTSLTTGHQTNTPATRWNLVGAASAVVTLPNASYPEANSKDYNRMVVITAGVGHTWGFGTIYMHYNA